MAWFVLVKDPPEAGQVGYTVHGLTNDADAAMVWECAGHQVIELDTMPIVAEEPFIPRN